MNTATATATAPRQAASAPPSASAIAEIDMPKSPGKALSPIQEVRGQLDNMEPQFRMALPAHIPAERYVRVLMTAISANPDLIMKCSRTSLFAAAMKCAQDGLLPDGREAALIPFKGVVQYLPMVAGILKKIRNSGQLSTIVARVVYAGDKFRNWIDDEGEHIEYEAADDQDRSIVRRVFAMAKLKDGSIEVEVLQPADIEKIRNVSRAKDNGPWVSWWDQMAQKSAIRRLSKRLPISTDLDDVIRRDDSLYDFEGAREQAEIANGGKPQSLGSRLDALAQMPDGYRDPSSTVEDGQDGDDAGDGDQKPTESKAPDQASDPKADAGAPQETGNATTEPSPEKTKLLEELQPKARKGVAALNRAIGGISKERMALLGQDDHDALRDVAEAADGKGGSNE